MKLILGALVDVGRDKEKGGREGKKRMKERGKERGTEQERQQEHEHKTRPTILVAIWVVYPAGKKSSHEIEEGPK